MEKSSKTPQKSSVPAPATVDNAGPRGFRLAVFAVPEDDEAFVQVMRDQLGLNAIDAKVHMHGLPGLLPDQLTEPVAAKLAAAIRELGVEAQPVDEGTLPQFEHTPAVHHVRCTVEGLELVGPSGAVDVTVPWPQVALISIADVPLEAVRHYGVSPTAVIRAGPGRVSPPTLDKPAVRGAEIWIVCEHPFRAIHIDHREMNYEYLGDRKAGSAAANFAMFVDDLASHAPHVYWTPSARAYRNRDPAEQYRFDTQRAHRDATTLQVLLMRRVRRAGVTVAAEEPPFTKGIDHDP
jgi:hypothetical protein